MDFATSAPGRFSGWNLKCKRRLQHMVNAVRFMALAKDELNEKPQAEDKCLMGFDCISWPWPQFGGLSETTGRVAEVC